jgi:hypothetical protein
MLNYRRAGLCGLLACCVLGAGVAAEPYNGKYCLYPGKKSSVMFLVRRIDGNHLQFGLSIWDDRGHNFTIAGDANPISPGYWIYPDPDTLCVAGIQRLPNGDWKVTATDAPKCSKGQGLIVTQVEIFPPASRQGDAPARFGVPEVFNTGCAERKP